MRHHSHRRRAPTVQREILPGGHRVHPVRYRGRVSLSLGRRLSRPEAVRLFRDAGVRGSCARRIFLCMEEGRAGLVAVGTERGTETLMLPESLSEFPVAAALNQNHSSAITGGHAERGEMILVEGGGYG